MIEKIEKKYYGKESKKDSILDIYINIGHLKVQSVFWRIVKLDTRHVMSLTILLKEVMD